MPLTYSDQQRRAYLVFTDKVGSGWINLFAGDTEFYSAAYWDLLTHLWRVSEPVRKTDAIAAITGVKSPLTASKYIDTALTRGLIVEKENPNDARSKLIALSPQMRAQMDAFFDDAVDEMKKAVAGL
ncbi:MarR family winged helix-turn-helix transcriptional regulator [Thalassospiraceae bacterium LMO-JJ14]|nr:MarR family winged helix-turn-helix transcriptional regulator [Thalassospiraceae bacterium LMO-JJ14]